MYPALPLEFVIHGTAVSLQGSSSSRAAWKQLVHETAQEARGPDLWAFDTPLAITLYYFPEGEMQGDIDNIVKPILDGLTKCIFLDDHQIERIVIQKFEPDNIFPFGEPSPALVEAMGAQGAATYVKVSDDPHGELA